MIKNISIMNLFDKHHVKNIMCVFIFFVQSIRINIEQNLYVIKLIYNILNFVVVYLLLVRIDIFIKLIDKKK